MKKLLLILSVLCVAPVFAREATISEAEKNPAAVTAIILDQSADGPTRLMKLSGKLNFLKTVVF